MRPISPYEELGNAIIIQACKDYRLALRTNNVRHLIEIEKFFLSGWYLALSEIDGRYILDRLRKEYQNENNQTLLRDNDSDQR